MNKSVKRKKQCGFTLIEIMIAMVIFAIGILAVGKMQIAAIKGNSSANGLTKAVILAQDRMEELISLSYTNSLNNDADGDGTNQDINKDGVDDDGGAFGLDDNTTATADHNDLNNPVDGRYNIFWNIAVDYPIDNVKEIKIIIKWTDKNTPREISMAFIKPDII